MKWDVRYWIPHGSKTFYELNPNPLSPNPKPKPAAGDESLATNTGKSSHTGRTNISITSYRRRLLDPDNLCPKYFIDALRYQRIIPNDREKDITYSISQKKVEKKNQEKTLIVVTYAN